jgi:chemotaxis protein CheX
VFADNPFGSFARFMKTIPSATDVLNYTTGHLTTVFDTMLSMKVAPAAQCDLSRFANGRVTGTVGLAGESVTGSVYLHLSAAFAVQVTSAMLGMAPEAITGTSDVNDVMGEVTNMLGGGLKSWLCDAGATCVLTTPAVIRGNSYTITCKPNVELIEIAFDCGAEHGLVEVHLKYS